MKKLLSIILLALPVTVMASHFNGNDIRISSETWKVDKDDKLIIESVGTDIRVIPADTGNPDVAQFEMMTPSDEVDHSWSIDFVGVQDTIKLVFISPEVVTPDYQYNYDTNENVGFHFQDVDDTYPPITAVRASPSFAPKGFDPSLIRFDENNIYVNLKGSSCKYSSVPRVNECSNKNSPTGLNNIIKLNVAFESDPNVYRVKEIDLLFDWLEENYPRYFPSHQVSFYSKGYRTRYYPSNDGYLYVKGLDVFFYNYDVSVEFVSLDYWLDVSGIATKQTNEKEARREKAREEAARKEEARQEEERREEKLRQEEIARQKEIARQEKPEPYDPYHEESDSYKEELNW